MQATTRRLAITGMAAGALLAAVPAHAQQFTMKLSQPTINDVTYEYFKRMKAGIEQRSAGKIKVDIYPSNQLGQLPAVAEERIQGSCGTRIDLCPGAVARDGRTSGVGPGGGGTRRHHGCDKKQCTERATNASRACWDFIH